MRMVRVAVTVVLLLAAVSVAAAQTPPAVLHYPELVLVNGKVVTVDDRFRIARAVAVRQDRILAVGTDAEVRALAGPETRVIDVGGRTVVPGLIDSHNHMLRAGFRWPQEVRLDEMTSVEEILAAVKARAARLKPGEWILTLGGWHESQLRERRMPTREELTAAAPENPVLLHELLAAAVMNDLAAKALGVTAPDGIVRGAPNVVAIKAKLPPVPFEQKVQGLRAVMKDFNGWGITSTVEPIGGEMTDNDYEPAFELWRRKQMTIRMGLNIVVKDLEGARWWIQALPGRFGDDWLKILGLGEIVIQQMWDQSVVASFPISRDTLADFEKVVRDSAQKGITLHLHATLESTINTMLGVFEEIDRQHPLRDLRLVFAHGEHITPPQLERMKKLGMGITVQDRQVIQADIMKRVWGDGMVAKPPLATIYRTGIPMGGGTDGTIVAPNSPFISMWWMITGKTLRGDVARTREHLTRAEALRVYTRGSAWVAHSEDRVGSIEPGKLADLAVLTADYLTVPEDDIRKITSVLTVIGGKVVHDTLK
ncbi:MAG: amidohydrolase [Candidatus Rokubacteria bacterium]|nr:amidohydrolase [Candidatus Rokubacteria bacterium]